MADVPPPYENGQDIRDRTFAFACRVVKCCQKIYDEGGVGRMLVHQLAKLQRVIFRNARGSAGGGE